MKKIPLILCLLLMASKLFDLPADTLVISPTDSKFLTNQYFKELENPNQNLSIADVINNDGFHSISTTLPILKFSKTATWLKFSLKNNTHHTNIPVSMGRVILDEFEIYYKDSTGRIVHLSPQKPAYDQNNPIRAV